MNFAPIRRLGAVMPAATIALTVLLALAVVLGRPAAAQETPAEIAPGVLEGEPAALDCTIGADGLSVTPPAETDAAFAIVSEKSEARYRAQEELAGRGAVEAVGATSAFIGQILFDGEGTPLACSRFDIDLRTLASDQPRRDNYLYGNTLQTEQFPLATFVLSEVKGLDEPLTEGEEKTFTLVGNLTVHGVTKLVAWEATVTLDGDTLDGTATTTFDMPDFDITPPVVGAVISLDESVALEVDIIAQRAG